MIKIFKKLNIALLSLGIMCSGIFVNIKNTEVSAATPKQSSVNKNIMGTSTLTSYQMASYVLKHNPDNIKLMQGVSILKLAQMYLEEGAKEGVRGDVAFAQSIKETGYFSYEGSAVSPKQNNYGGIGATGGKVKGNSFKSPRIGVRAQIQHLKAYASKQPLKQSLVDPRFHLVSKRGSITTFPGLHGKWAMQKGGNYGTEILRLHSKMAKLPKNSLIVVKPVKKTYYTKVELNLRLQAGWNHKVITTVSKGVAVASTKTKTVKGVVWHYVKVNGQAGWINGEYLRA